MKIKYTALLFVFITFSYHYIQLERERVGNRKLLWRSYTILNRLKGGT